MDETAKCDPRYNSSPVKKQKSVAHHLDTLNRMTINNGIDINDALRRIEQIERFLGVSFSQPRSTSDIAPLDFESPPNL